MIMLKSCPFCNGKPKIMVREQKFLGQYENGKKDKLLGFYVRCNRCYARGGLYTLYTDNPNNELGIKHAIEKWNYRNYGQSEYLYYVHNEDVLGDSNE